MSWIRENSLNFIQRLAIKIIKSGEIPKHVGIIMDGNRRYAKKIHSNKLIEGHMKGFDKLTETLQWCLDLGVSEVTVYAFSIENFHRSQEEVDDLMNLMRQKFKRLLDEKDKLKEKGIRIRILGNLTLLPVDICYLISEVMEITKTNNKGFLNIALSYTSRDEITRAVKNIVEGVQNDDIQISDIDEHLISQCLDANTSPNVDILIRTSGENRLSDFLLWQSSSTYIHFVNSLWPEFNLWDLLSGIFYYQLSYEKLQAVRHKSKDENLLKKAYIQKVHNKRLQELLEVRKIEIQA